MDKRPWHAITDDEHAALLDAGATWDEVMRQYAQPDWCGYHNALAGDAGCWGLVGRTIRSEEDCRRCDCYQPQAEARAMADCRRCSCRSCTRERHQELHDHVCTGREGCVERAVGLIATGLQRVLNRAGLPGEAGSELRREFTAAVEMIHQGMDRIEPEIQAAYLRGRMEMRKEAAIAAFWCAANGGGCNDVRHRIEFLPALPEDSNA